MPSIISNELNDTKSIKISDIRSNGDSTLRKRRLRSDSAAEDGTKSKSPRRCINGGLNCTENGIIEKESGDNKVVKSRELLVKKLSDDFIDKPKWNPRDVKFKRHNAFVLTAASVYMYKYIYIYIWTHTVVCREDEKKRVLEFCKQCIEQEKAGSLYVCGCPGTGKSLLMERVKGSLVDWARGKLIIADELDYLITKDRAALHDLFTLTTFPFARCILIGIANAIDLADRFLPRLQSLNWKLVTCFSKPMVVTFRAYSKDQIIMILQPRLMALPLHCLSTEALELCARKVAAASGDMRKALCICRSAIEMLQAEVRESACNLDFSLAENGYSNQQTTPPCNLIKQGIDIVRVDHMAIALSKTYRSPIMDTVQSLPQHQQIIICSAVKLFRGGKKDTTIGELSKSYLDICKLTLIPPVGIMELSSMCRVLGDQGLLKLGQSREDKLRRVALKVDEADVAFALQGIRAFRNCLNACQ
ncbi:hypothetical protein LOK49_Contig324G00002 [Camellia lanceoleosa]|nr:hypothetical protein LOK49_Contig324G00002 [Camellia lanceoleosa]